MHKSTFAFRWSAPVLAALLLASDADTSSAPIEGSASLPDTVVVLGTVERDLTGDGRPETLRLVGVGQSIDSLDVTFSVASSGRVIFQTALAPLTRTVGFGSNRRRITAAEHRAALKDVGSWFFGATKFKQPAEFIVWLRGSAPGSIPQIPGVIARDRGVQLLLDSLVAAGDSHRNAERRVNELPRRFIVVADTARGNEIWDEIQKSEVTLFEFSSGGDSYTAIAWSTADQRFYRLLECC